MYKLIIEDDEGHTTVVPLIQAEITIGRKEGNAIRLTERNVSRQHARLVRSNGAVFIEDLDSAITAIPENKFKEKKEKLRNLFDTKLNESSEESKKA